MTFIYGDADWMEPAAGQRVARAVLQHRGRLSPTDGQVRSAVALFVYSIVNAHALSQGAHRLSTRDHKSLGLTNNFSTSPSQS